MTRFVVVENPDRWPLHIPGIEVVSARSYLADARFSSLRGATIFNLCRSYAYQGLGYYVSLLAAARGHRPLPSVDTLQDLRLSPVLRIVSEELDARVQRSLAPLRSERFELSIYFGRNVTPRYDGLARALFAQFPAPFLRASFANEEGRWRLTSLRILAANDVPEHHHEFVIERATEYLARSARPRGRPAYRYDLAILVDPKAKDSPSNEQALRRFVRAAQALGIDAQRIEREDQGQIAEFDALFIRETTWVDHHTYRIARRAALQGLVVVDDPESIVRCTNKVYQAELFRRKGIPHPDTLLVHGGNREQVVTEVGLPCVLKRPDSSFSRGVVKVESAETLQRELDDMLEDSELVVAQRFVRSGFDWRVGVLGGKALWTCRYHMARGHWQIADHRKGQTRYGRVEAVPLGTAPAAAVELAERAAALIGDGLYGVDLKQADDRFLVMEVNDNPNIDAGFEDQELGDVLYETVMRYFLERLEARGAERRP